MKRLINSLSLRRDYIDCFLNTALSNQKRDDKTLNLGGTPGKGNFQFRWPENVCYVNMAFSSKISIQGDGCQLPFKSNVFSHIVCTETIEHVFNTQKFIAEMIRVLRPGGKILITSPFLYPIHSAPRDFFRFSSQYWTQISLENHLGIEMFEKQGLFFSTVFSFFHDFFQNKILKHQVLGALKRPINLGFILFCFFLKVGIHCLEREKWVQNDQFFSRYPSGYGILLSDTRTVHQLETPNQRFL